MERYYTFSRYCQETFGRKLYKISLNAGMNCPNRDGTLAEGGCIFCDKGGSGDFAALYTGQKLNPEEMPYTKSGKEGSYIGYFQAYTNTYAPVEKLRFLFVSALKDPVTAGISIATRPDCMPDEVMDLLQELKQSFPDKFIWIELGLQSIHESTAKWIRRGYELPVFEDCVRKLKEIGIPIIVHVIIGLPGESREMNYETIAYLNRIGIDGIKLQLLHILKDTDLYSLYQRGEVEVLSKQEYAERIAGCIGRLSKNIVIHRLTGDGDPKLLAAPLWSLKKMDVINTINHELKVENIVQGVLYES